MARRPVPTAKRVADPHPCRRSQLSSTVAALGAQDRSSWTQPMTAPEIRSQSVALSQARARLRLASAQTGARECEPPRRAQRHLSILLTNAAGHDLRIRVLQQQNKVLDDKVTRLLALVGEMQASLQQLAHRQAVTEPEVAACRQKGRSRTLAEGRPAPRAPGVRPPGAEDVPAAKRRRRGPSRREPVGGAARLASHPSVPVESPPLVPPSSQVAVVDVLFGDEGEW